MTPIITEHAQIVVVALLPDQCQGLWKVLEPLVIQGKKNAVVDLTKVPFLDSVSIAALIACRNKAFAVDKRFVVANLSPNILAVFRILKLDRMFEPCLSGWLTNFF